MTDPEGLAALVRAWDEAADGYERYFVPRFAPWMDLAVREITQTGLPAGPVLVPCCGTFPELPALLARAGGWSGARDIHPASTDPGTQVADVLMRASRR